MSDDRTIQQIADDSVAAVLAAHKAARRPLVPTVEQQLEAVRFRELVTREALMADVRPQAVRHIVRDAETVFELKEDVLVAKHNAVDPYDPLVSLSPRRWLEQLAKTDGYLFAPPTRAH